MPSNPLKLISANGAMLPSFQTELTAQVRDWGPLAELGITGINRTGTSRAIVEADWLPQIRNGREYVMAMREIAFNDPIAFAGLTAMDLLMRQTPWRVDPYSDKPEHKEQAEYLEACMGDMAQSWGAVISEANACLWGGFSLLEMRFKRRRGFNIDAVKSSDFDDNKWGFARFAPRAQHTVWYWIYDENNSLIGLRQLAPPDWNERVIPISKCLHITPRGSMENPWGHSVLRGAFVPYFFLKRLREIEGIGIERDLAGLPVVHLPAEYLLDSATPKQKETKAYLESFVQNVRRDAKEGFLFPLEWDEEGKNKLFEFELTTSGGTRQLNIGETVTRYEQRIATSMLADFMMLGQGEGAGGSYALSADKSSLFKTALEAYLDVIADEFHRKAVRKLWRLNGWDPAEAPHWVPGSIGKRDLAMFGAYLTAVSGTGFPIWPNPELAKYVFEVGDMPELTEEQLEQQEAYAQAQQFTSLGLGPDGQPIEDPAMAGQTGPGGRPLDDNEKMPPPEEAPGAAGKPGAGGGKVKVKVEVPQQPAPEGGKPTRPKPKPA